MADEAWNALRVDLARGREQAFAEPDAESLPESRLARALDALPPVQREVLALELDGGLTFAQVGELLGISPNTAASATVSARPPRRRASPPTVASFHFGG